MLVLMKVRFYLFNFLIKYNFFFDLFCSFNSFFFKFDFYYKKNKIFLPKTVYKIYIIKIYKYNKLFLIKFVINKKNL